VGIVKRPVNRSAAVAAGFSVVPFRGCGGPPARQPPIIPPRIATGFVAGRGGRGGGLPGAPPAVPCGPKFGLRGGAMGRRLRWPSLSTGFL
jgi:hypothetical protein